jgi:hypothetical protein
MANVLAARAIGSAYSFDVSGSAATRVIPVEGLGSNEDMLYQAVLSTGIVYGQPHPTIPGIFCQSVSAAPLAGESRINAIVTAQYGWYCISGGQVQVRLSGMRSVLHANKDPVTGGTFQVTYTAPGGKSASNLCLFDIYSSHLVAEVVQLETQSPKIKSTQYVGRVNSEAGWQGVGGYGGNTPGLWLCQNIDGQQVGNGNYIVTYRFEFAPEGWTQLAWYEDANTHIIPADIQLSFSPAYLASLTISGPINNGIIAQVPTQVPFNALGLPNF